MSKFKVLFQFTGSIACFKAASVVSGLIKKGYEVQTVCSKSAQEFIGPATLEGLTGKPVITSSFQQGQMMGHIDWARWADIIVLCPASAHTINHLACGTLDGIIGDIYLANNFKKPYLIVPAMNTQMLNHPSTQNSLSTLKTWGALILETESGELACGEYGQGRLPEPSIILGEIEKILKPAHNKNIIITAGGTTEPIDGVRSITNFSTGETGRVLAEQLSQRFNVYYVKSASSKNPIGAKEIFNFKTSNDLEKILLDLIESKEFDAVIQAAAISDFTVANHIEDKIPSDNIIKLELVPRNKIITQIKSKSLNKKIKVIGFKLTNTQDDEVAKKQVLKLSMNPNIDFIIHNEIPSTRGNEHKSQIYKKDKVILSTTSKTDLAREINNILESP